MQTITNFITETAREIPGWYQEPLFWLFPVASNVIALAAFILMAVPLTVLVIWNPPWLQKYYIQSRQAANVRERRSSSHHRTIRISVKQLLINYSILIVLSCLSWPVLRLTGIHVGLIPPWYVIVAQIVLFAVLDDFLYYWMHRTMHLNPYLYKKIHTVHHRITTPIAISGNYMHPIEFLLISTMILIGPILVGAHIVTVWIWVVVRQWEAAEQHSGLQFPWNPMHWLPLYDGPVFHDFHHSKFFGNYAGLLSWTDTVFGTRSKSYDAYLKSHAAELTVIEDDPEKNH